MPFPISQQNLTCPTIESQKKTCVPKKAGVRSVASTRRHGKFLLLLEKGLLFLSLLLLAPFCEKPRPLRPRASQVFLLFAISPCLDWKLFYFLSIFFSFWGPLSKRINAECQCVAVTRILLFSFFSIPWWFQQRRGAAGYKRITQGVPRYEGTLPTAYNDELSSAIPGLCNLYVCMSHWLVDCGAVHDRSFHRI